MIDNIGIRTQCTDQEFERLTARLDLSAPIDSEKVKVNWSNLRFVYYPNAGSLTLTNSLHKFYNLEFNDSIRAAVNHDSFTLSNFYTVVDYLSEYVFEKAATNLTITGRFEFGLNVYTDSHNPFDLLCKYESIITTHANQFFTVPPYRGKPQQRNCHFSDWFFKGYNKGKQAELLNVNLVRFEVVVNELRKLRNILNLAAVSLADICTQESWDKLFNFLVRTYDSIRKIPEIENLQLTIGEINSIYSYCNKLMRSDLKKHLSRYYFESINKQNKIIYDRYNLKENNYHNVIKNKMYKIYKVLLPEPLSNFSTCNELCNSSAKLIV